MSDKWVTADLHLGHKNIIKHARRPFKSVEEMDEGIITHWNARVRPGDIVYIVGDFAWGTAADYVAYARVLNGQKFLIKGNHDYGSVLQSLD